MTDTQKKPLWKNELVWLFLLTSGLFAILYSKFILSGYAYVFTDTGADTMQINYAQYGLFSSLFRSGESGYVLQAGLGMDVSSYYPAYLIPYNLLIRRRLLCIRIIKARQRGQCFVQSGHFFYFFLIPFFIIQISKWKCILILKD